MQGTPGGVSKGCGMVEARGGWTREGGTDVLGVSVCYGDQSHRWTGAENFGRSSWLKKSSVFGPGHHQSISQLPLGMSLLNGRYCSSKSILDVSSSNAA